MAHAQTGRQDYAQVKPLLPPQLPPEKPPPLEEPPAMTFTAVNARSTFVDPQ